MKTNAIGLAVVATLIGTPVLAADMTLKAEPPAAYSWTGCYVGVNGGYGWDSGRSTYQDPNTTDDPINGIPSSGGNSVFIPTPSDTRGSGGLVGGSAGCNWQRQQWVFGIEGDFDWAHISGSQTTVGPNTMVGPGFIFYGVGPAGANGTGVATEQVSLHWLSTVRARLGFAVDDRLLLFATAGAAFGGVDSQGSVSINFPPFSPITWSGSNTTVRAGAVVGGGAEWAFSGHWTLKGEYLWYNLGSVSHPLNCTSGGGAGAPCNPIFFFPTLGNASSPVFGSIVRAGINYKFQ